ncbi:hypothetical protein Vretimale_14463 [Volvox reticuliferus]|uniref:Uncharacterized protein n=1 Tax=Volvox reticuliferus TaxID=1737510 RepID=A0A8J4LU03_9CHLO|nr:hypothetical protein Vretimale_14463 [Volvox reticuliferus]
MLRVLRFRCEMLAQHGNGINEPPRLRVDDVMVRPVNRYRGGSDAAATAASKQQLGIAAVRYRSGGGCGVGGGGVPAAGGALRLDHSWRYDLLRDLSAGQTIAWKSGGERYHPS